MNTGFPSNMTYSSSHEKYSSVNLKKPVYSGEERVSQESVCGQEQEFRSEPHSREYSARLQQITAKPIQIMLNCEDELY